MTLDTSKENQILDALLGADEDITEDLASAILAQNGVDEFSLVDDFKELLQKELRTLSQDSQEALNLKNTVRNITEYQRASSPDLMKPPDLITGMFNDLPSAFPKPVYAFHKRQEGEMPAEDQAILENLADELDKDEE